jgi:6-pyruvoyltetrahydropterin/6-carboxytetrahydropterin synthase
MKSSAQIFELSQSFYFEAAHTLLRKYDSKGSRRIHGHTYEAEVVVTGSLDKNTGMLVDLAFLRKEIERVRLLLDHQFLDEIKDLGPATLENLAAYIAINLIRELPNLSSIVVQRKCSGDKCTLRL